MTWARYLTLAAAIALSACAGARVATPVQPVEAFIADQRPDEPGRKVALEGRIFLLAPNSTMLTALSYAGPEGDSRVPEGDRCVQILLSRSQYRYLKRSNAQRVRVFGDVAFVSPPFVFVRVDGRKTTPDCQFDIAQDYPIIPLIYVRRVELLP